MRLQRRIEMLEGSIFSPIMPVLSDLRHRVVTEPKGKRT
jgi:hypothetical protein